MVTVFTQRKKPKGGAKSFKRVRAQHGTDSPEKRQLSRMSNHVEVKNIEPTAFEDRYYDEYEYYNLTDRYTECTSRKGRTKKESNCNTNRPNPAGHERKITEKLQNAEKNSKE